MEVKMTLKAVDTKMSRFSPPPDMFHGSDEDPLSNQAKKRRSGGMCEQCNSDADPLEFLIALEEGKSGITFDSDKTPFYIDDSRRHSPSLHIHTKAGPLGNKRLLTRGKIRPQDYDYRDY